MAKVETSVTRLSASFVAQLRERFDWHKLEVRERLAGGYANDIYRAEADGTTVVVRVVRRPVDVVSLAWEHRLLGLLARQVDEVVAPLMDREGATFALAEGNAVVVLPYVDGAPAEPWFDAPAAAVALANFHRAAARIDREPRPGLFPLAHVRDGIASGDYFAVIGPTAHDLPPELSHRRAEVDAAREWVLQTIDELAGRGLTTAPIHGDVFRGNMLVRGGRVVAIVDWEEANVDWVAYDLANAMWEFCKCGDLVLKPDSAADFVRVYREAGGTVPPGEDDTLIPLVRIRRVLELIRAPYDRTVDWNYQLCNLEAFHGLA